jgi:predicted P-loop ATPase
MPDEKGPDWTESLMVSEKGTFVPNLHNAILMLSHDLRVRGSIGLNVRGQVPWCLRDSPAGPSGAWTDAHTSALTGWLQHENFALGAEIVDRAIGVVGRENPVNPVGDWLRARASAWDREERLAAWLPTYLGAEDTKLNRALGPMVLIGAAARGIDPGVQCDTVPVFEGIQGSLKSSAIRVLGGPFGCESLPDFHSKDAALVVGRYWIIEIAELTALLRSPVAELNAFISRRKDSYRPPYGRYVIEQPRGAFLIGSCNPQVLGYLRDPTGGRRFIPVAVGTINLSKLRDEVEQLWGEAATRYLEGKPWWPGSEILAELGDAQSKRYEGDIWEGRILEIVEEMEDPFTIERVVTRAFPEIHQHRIDKAMQTRIGSILSTRMPPLKCVRRYVGGTRVRLYSKSDLTEDDPKTEEQE